MTSSEMRCFTHYFTLIVGRYVPIEDRVWTYCKSLITLVDLCLKRSFSIEETHELQESVNYHHTLYINLFKKDLKPKHHFIVHYPSIIRTSGPIDKMMCFRYEVRHRGFKQYSHVVVKKKSLLHARNKSQFTILLRLNQQKLLINIVQ